MANAAQNFTILQGETFSKVLRWEAPPIVYKDITAITAAAPAVVTAVGHGLVDGWRVAITNVGGMEQINAKGSPPKASDYVKATFIDVDNIELNTVNAAGFDPYTSGGVLQYNTPVSLSGFTARMDIKPSVNSTTVLHSMTDANSGIVIDDVAKTITLVITAADTAAFTWTNGVYDLEMIDGTGIVTRLISGSVTVSKNVTT